MLLKGKYLLCLLSKCKNNIYSKIILRGLLAVSEFFAEVHILGTSTEVYSKPSFDRVLNTHLSQDKQYWLNWMTIRRIYHFINDGSIENNGYPNVVPIWVVIKINDQNVFLFILASQRRFNWFTNLPLCYCRFTYEDC